MYNKMLSNSNNNNNYINISNSNSNMLVYMIVKNSLIHFLLLVILLNLYINKNYCALIRFEDFYSQSFLPDVLQVSYRIENEIGIYYNFSALIAFPGKLLFSIFVRKLGGEESDSSQNMVKYKNLDFCKTIELVKNFTTENFHSENLLQPTFITSCPLTRGFYYIENGTVEDEILPVYFTSGSYWLQLELVQIFDEVTKLINIRARCIYESRW